MSNHTTQTFDVVIAGGGMVGAALAAALAQEDFRVAVIERREPAREWPQGELSNRVSALSRASQNLLKNLAVWDRMRSLGVSPYQAMQVWDAGGSGSIRFDSAEVGEPDLGHIVENRVTQLALWERLEHLPQVSLICPASVRSFALSPSQAHITLDDGRELACALLVAADGRDSMVREFAGVNTLGWAYDQSALVANVAHQAPHQQTAWQRFLPSGPLAFLPLADGRSSIVWSTSPAAAKQLLALDEGVFCQALGEAFEQRLGAIETVGPRGVFPLRLQHAERYVLPRLALIGDAAHAIHPLAGQGVNLGFLDAAELAQVLVAARQRGRDIGALPVLRRYERARKGDNLAMLGAMDLFKRLFSNDSMPLRLLRNTGLGLADRIFPAKRSLLRRALGIGMDLPELANPGNHQKTP